MGAGVTETIRSGITNISYFQATPDILAYGMLCALSAVAVWLLVATYFEVGGLGGGGSGAAGCGASGAAGRHAWHTQAQTACASFSSARRPPALPLFLLPRSCRCRPRSPWLPPLRAWQLWRRAGAQSFGVRKRIAFRT